MDEQGTNFGMDAFIAGSTFKAALGGSYDRRPPALVICDGAEERSRLEVMLDAAGARLLGTVNLAEAIERLDRIASVRLIVLKAGANSPLLLELLQRIEIGRAHV